MRLMPVECRKKKSLLRLSTLLLAALLALPLSACSIDTLENAEIVVQGALDAAYLGQASPDYLKLTNLTEEEAAQAFQARMDAQVSRFCTYWRIVNPRYDVAYEDLDASLKEDIADLYRDIYSHANYRVDYSAISKNGDSVVGLSMLSIELMQKANDDYATYEPLLHFIGQYSLAEVEAMSRTEYIAYSSQYGEVIVQLVRDHLSDITYGEMKTLAFTVTLDADGYLKPDGDWETLDSYLITYPE